MLFHFLGKAVGIALIVCLYVSVRASEPNQLQRVIRFDKAPMTGEIPYRTVFTIQQDHRGFMWFGTRVGLFRYDGLRFLAFNNDPNNPRSIAEDYIRRLLVDQKGRIWVGTHSHGLGWIDPYTLEYTHQKQDSPLETGLVYDLVESHDKVWVASDTGLFAFDIEDSDAHTQHKPNHSFIPHVMLAGKNRLFIASGLELFTFENGLFANIPIEQFEGSLTGSRILTIKQCNDGWLWLGTDQGLHGIDFKTKVIHSFLPNQKHGSLSNAKVTSIYQHDPSGLWVATDGGGLNYFDRESRQFTTYMPDRSDPYSLTKSELMTIYGDRSGVIWVGARFGGVNKFNPASFPFNHYRLDGVAQSEMPLTVMSLREGKGGTLWVGTAKGLMQFDSDQKLVQYFEPSDDPESLGGEQITALLEDRSGHLWVGTEKGLHRSKSNQTNDIRFQRNLGRPADLDPSLEIHFDDIYQDRDDDIWAASTIGLIRFNSDGKKMDLYQHRETEQNSLSHDKVRVFYQDSRGLFWVGTQSGLNLMEQPGHFQSFKNNGPESISHNRIHVIHEDRSGELWIGTFDGLNRLVRGDSFSFVNYHERDGILADTISGILDDDWGNLWLSTSMGIIRFNPESGESRLYDARDGLQMDGFYVGSFFGGKDTNMYFGGVNGFNRFIPDQIKDNPVSPPVVLTGVSISNSPVTLNASHSQLKRIEDWLELKISYDQKMLSLDFAALDFATPQKNKYAYILEGQDEDWRYTDAQKAFATYTNLDSGPHKFKIRGSNKDGVWSDPVTVIKVVVSPPPWQTWWAYCFYALFIILLIGWFLRLTKQKLIRERRQKEALDQEVSRQTGELRQKTNEILAQQQQLLEQSSKLQAMDQAKNRFFTNISHELRTPLTLTLGPIEDLLLEEQTPSHAKTRLELAHRNGAQLLRLVKEILDISKLESGQMKLSIYKGDLAAFAKRCSVEFLALAERNEVALVFQKKQHPVEAFFDPSHMKTILSNLLSNALKHTPPRGKVMISVKSLDRQIEISVKDTGEGIPLNEIDHVFDRFFQASAGGASTGSGIGLSLVKELVNLHGGEIQVESQPGFGSIFSIFLPKKRDPSHLSPLEIDMDHWFTEAIHPDIPNQGSPETSMEEDDHDHVPLPSVLVVEDHPDMRAYIRDHMTKDHQVYLAQNGSEGLEIARKHIPNLIISDVMMPDIDGMELCRELKADRKTNHIPIILLTAKATTEAELEGLAQGADDYVTKPFDARVLISRATNLIHSRQKMHQQYQSPIIPKATEVEAPSAEQSFVTTATDSVEQHMEDTSFGVYELADELGFSRRQLHRKLKAITGLTPVEFIRKIRLERAAQLLAQGAGGVAQVAYAVGYSQPKHFSKLFSEAYGVNPSEFKGKGV